MQLNDKNKFVLFTQWFLESKSVFPHATFRITLTVASSSEYFKRVRTEGLLAQARTKASSHARKTFGV